MDALHEITRKQIGVTAIVERGTLAGLFTDGDLRRLLERVGDIRDIKVADVMTREPLTIAPDVLAAEAAQIMDQRRKNVLVVVNPNREVAGVLSMPDLLAAKVI
jgi:arabinose-5-phosphate isomerase